MSTNDEKHSKAYGAGKHDSKNTGGAGHIGHDFGDLVDKFVPKWENTEQSSYEAGWHDHEGLEHRTPKSRSPSKNSSVSGYVGDGGGGGATGSRSSRIGAGLGGIGVVVGGIIGFIGGILNAGEKLSQYRGLEPRLDMTCGLPIMGAIVGAVIGGIALGVLGFLFRILKK